MTRQLLKLPNIGRLSFWDRDGGRGCPPPRRAWARRYGRSVMSGSAKPGDLHVPAHPVRFVTAAALFDGHDAAINIMRRILQAQGAEVIHLGHDRSVREVVDAVLEEDAQGVAISSYQGGHVEYFEYLAQLLT